MTHAAEPKLVIVARRKHVDQDDTKCNYPSRFVQLNAQMLKPYFAYPLVVAAKSLGLGETALKRY